MKQWRKIMVVFLVAMLCLSTIAVTVASAATKVTMIGDTYLRKGPGKGYGIRAVMKKGKIATYLNSYKKDSRGVYWLKVSYNSKVGWVSTRYAKYGNNSSKDVKTTGKVYIRIAPNKYSKILGSVGKGKYLTYRGVYKYDSRGVKWYQVAYKGQNGWVSSKYSKLV